MLGEPYRWGVYQINNDNIQFEWWRSGDGLDYPTVKFSGKVINDTTLVLDYHARAVGREFAKSMVGTVGFSALAGGIGAELTGGEFWRGAATGATIGLLNHGAHAAANAINRVNRIPSTYSHKNGEQIVFKGHVYELHNNKWVFLSGEMVDVAAISGHTNGGVYIPVASNFVDRAIYEADMRMVYMVDVKGITAGAIIDKFVTGFFKVNPNVMLATFLYGAYNNIFEQIQKNTYHNSQVDLLRNP